MRRGVQRESHLSGEDRALEVLDAVEAHLLGMALLVELDSATNGA